MWLWWCLTALQRGRSWLPLKKTAAPSSTQGRASFPRLPAHRESFWWRNPSPSLWVPAFPCLLSGLLISTLYLLWKKPLPCFVELFFLKDLDWFAKLIHLTCYLLFSCRKIVYLIFFLIFFFVLVGLCLGFVLLNVTVSTGNLPQDRVLHHHHHWGVWGEREQEEDSLWIPAGESDILFVHPISLLYCPSFCNKCCQ